MFLTFALKNSMQIFVINFPAQKFIWKFAYSHNLLLCIFFSVYFWDSGGRNKRPCMAWPCKNVNKKLSIDIRFNNGDAKKFPANNSNNNEFGDFFLQMEVRMRLYFQIWIIVSENFLDLAVSGIIFITETTYKIYCSRDKKYSLASRVSKK